jgi:hypothetical protein
MLEINKQSMKYSLQGQTVTIYEKDDDGNNKYYETSDGEKIYYTHEANGYSDPVDFMANIAFSGGEAQNEEYGFNTADFDAILLTDREECPLAKGSLIWLNSEVTRTSEGTIDETSADFIVVGVKSALASTKYVLRAVVK